MGLNEKDFKKNLRNYNINLTIGFVHIIFDVFDIK